MEPSRGDADHLERMAIERDGPAYRTGGAPVTRLPEVVAEHCKGRAAAVIVGRHQKSACGRAQSQRAEQVAADEEAVDIPHRTAARQIESFRAPGEGAGEYILMVADLFPDRVGD